MNIAEELSRLYFDNGLSFVGKKTIKLFAVEEHEWPSEAQTNETEVRYLAALKGAQSRFVSMKLFRSQGGKFFQVTVKALDDDHYPVMYQCEIEAFKSYHEDMLQGKSI